MHTLDKSMFTSHKGTSFIYPVAQTCTQTHILAHIEKLTTTKTTENTSLH